MHRPPASPSSHPPLLFVHGGYVDARCWDVHFLPFFVGHGYDCYAVDLGGHGKSDGAAELHTLGIDDFVDDVGGVLDRLPAPPVLIGHSMGAVIVERLLERSPARAGVLLSPVPPNGTLESATRLLLSHPTFLTAVADLSRGVLDDRSLTLVKDVYFTPRTTTSKLLEFAGLVQNESLRAIADLAFLAWRWPRVTPNRPLLVVGGQEDRVFAPYLAERVAKRWRAPLHLVPEAGHAMIVDDGWQACAEPVLTWLRRTLSASAYPTAPRDKDTRH